VTRAEFIRLLATMADGWRRRDYEQAAACFAESVRYGDPTRYSWRGRDALLAFFKDDDGKDQQVTWHHVLFDEATQMGAAEYTYVGTHQYHGLVLVKVADGLVTHWREYQHVTDVPWETFTEDTRVHGEA
jgi:hypothetical protein